MRLATSSRTDTRDQGDEPSDTTPGDDDTPRSRNQFWRRLATVLGLVAAACAVAFPFLPVVQDTAKIVWPNGGEIKPVNAPLTSYWAQDMQVRIPCATTQSLDSRSTGSAQLFSTIPAARSEEGAGMQIRVDDGMIFAFSRGEQIVRAPLPAQGCDITVASDAKRTTVNVGGVPVSDQDGDVRPRVIGIYSEITAVDAEVDGLDVSITPDTRYQSSPTGWKIAVAIIGLLALVGCLISVYRLDSGVARRAPRWAPIGWWRLTGRDVTVIAALGAWVFIGPVTSDDGYILTMARATEDTGYLPNYHRWFGVAEAPFGWFYHVYEMMAHVSTVPPWIRLPSFLLGVLSWLLISREVMPRLGKDIRSSRAAGWAAAVVFLVWWMPFNNGTRPEPVAAVGSLIAICAVERTLVTRRMLPLCLGLLAAALTLAATPTGLIAVAPFLVAAKPLFQLLRQRAREGWLPVLGPILGAGLTVLLVVFADQTFATVTEATRLRTQVGPNLAWFEELARYQLLFENSADGSLTRRFPVLLLILCTGACMVVLLRRGRIQGAALGPSRRLIGTVALFFLLLALTPTKWTHHFGAFAAVGAAMAALTALAVSSTVLRSKRNQAGFVSGLLVVAAFAATGPNAYWFVSDIGVPWFDKAPSIGGIGVSTVLLIGAAIAGIIAFVENVRMHRPGPPPDPHERRNRALKLGSLSLVIVCGMVALAEFASMAKAIHKQRGSYSLGAANLEHLTGSSCNLSDHVMVERDPLASVLAELPDVGDGAALSGFHTSASTNGDPLDKPPHGFTTDAVPMWSSYLDSETPTGRLRSGWYGLPADLYGGQVVIATNTLPGKATSVNLEFGSQTEDGIAIERSVPVLRDGGGSGSWSDARFNLGDLPKGVTMVRVTGVDNDLTEDGWVAATAPRVPTFTSLTQKVGNKPVYTDWPASFVYPCMQPASTRDGISEVPAYRVTAGDLANEGDVASNKGGGPNGWLEEVADQPEVPSFLQGAPSQPWGKLLEIDPYTEGEEPTVVRDRVVRPGWWSPGPGPSQADGKNPTR
ncbi:arabinosyltransferase [Amycolatopsis antarctica]|uniref:Arabinosyltransferase n=1 Tax=Amycolatopsis antarctica TaxID=1854586 RepID=A0A263D092_9PSEU|nr:arabinosyltransferase domain-containing protein [Amycolatopsis antarctica]OZM71864.1 arabinosyltransferase [Amycolatopsis antarctica]